VKSRALPEFWFCLEQLPPKVQKIARKNFKLWQKNPNLLSLRFKKIKHDLWAAPVQDFAGWPRSRMAAISGFGSAGTMSTSG